MFLDSKLSHCKFLTLTKALISNDILIKNQSKINFALEKLQKMKPKKGICVDGSCTKGNPGVIAFKIIRIETNEIILQKNMGTGTNNHAEFFGLCKAIQLFPNETIYCDSLTALSWVRKKRHNSKHKHQSLQNLKFVPDIRKWDTVKWGENLADFGYK